MRVKVFSLLSAGPGPKPSEMGCTHQGSAGKPGTWRDRGWKGDTGAVWFLLVLCLGGTDSGLLALLIQVPFHHPGNMEPAWWWGLSRNCTTTQLSSSQFNWIQHLC